MKNNRPFIYMVSTASVLFLSIWFYTVESTFIPRITSLLVVFVSAEMFTPYFVLSRFKMFVKNSKSTKLGIEMPLPLEMKALANKMGVKVNTMKVVPGMRNAFVRKGVVYFGYEILVDYPLNLANAVLAHELQHIKGRHQEIGALFAMMGVISLYPLHFLPGALFFLATLSFVAICIIPLNWFLEMKADEAGSDNVGKQEMIEALKLLDRNHSIFEEFHPSISSRVRNLERRN